MNALLKRFDTDALDKFWNESLFVPSALKTHAFDVNVAETENAYLIEAALPGIKREDINIEMTDDLLEIRVEQKKEENQNGSTYSLREISYGSTSRAFRLPRNIDRSPPEAELKDGILKITFPKTQKNKILIK